MTGQDEFAPLRIRTDDVPEPLRMEFVREYYGRILMGLEIVPDPDDRFRIEATAVLLPGGLVGSGTASALVSARTGPLLGDGNDDIYIPCAQNSFCISTPGGGDVEFAPGEIAAFTLGERVSMRQPPAARFQTVQLSRRVLGSLLPCIDDLGVMRIDPADPAARLLAHYARLLEIAPPESVETRTLAAGHLAELAALAISGGRRERVRGDGSGVRAARRAAVKAAIRAHLGRPELGVAAVAARLGISARYVHRLFEEEGLSFSAYVQRLRMDQVRGRLVDPRHAHRRIAELAFEAGFRDLSTFNRAFRRYYGETPSATRRRDN